MVYAKCLISVPVRLLETLRQCRRASASIKTWAAKRMTSVPARVSGIAEHSGNHRNPSEIIATYVKSDSETIYPAIDMIRSS